MDDCRILDQDQAQALAEEAYWDSVAYERGMG